MWKGYQRLWLFLVILLLLKALLNKRQRLESNLLKADHRSMNRAQTIMNPRMQHMMKEELNLESSRDSKNGPFAINPNNYVPDLSGDPWKTSIKTSNLEDEKTIRSLLLVNKLLKCTWGPQKTLNYRPALMVRRANTNVATITRTLLGLELVAQRRGTSQDCIAVQRNRVHAFGDCNRHDRVHTKSHKNGVPTWNMRKKCHVRSTPKEHREIGRDNREEQ